MMVICVIFSLAHRTTLESLFLNASLLFPQKLYFHGMSHMSNHVNYCARPYVRVREIFIVLTSYYSFSVRHLKRYVNTQSSANTSWRHYKSKSKFYISFKSSGCPSVFFMCLLQIWLTSGSLLHQIQGRKWEQLHLVHRSAESQLLNGRMGA